MKKTLDTESIDRLTDEYLHAGFAYCHAHERAWLEHRLEVGIDHRGMQIDFVLYGDFRRPPQDLQFPSLGLTLFSSKEPLESHKTAITSLNGTISLREPGLPGIRDAFERLNILIGCRTLLEIGQCSIGWTSRYAAHPLMCTPFIDVCHEELDVAIDGTLRLSPKVRQKVNAALHWISQQPSLIYEQHHDFLLHTYTGYWNAFECLVDALLLVRPAKKLTREEKQSQIDSFLSAKEGRLAPADIESLYRDVVNPGLKGKARHVFESFFERDFERYMNECFGRKETDIRLYNIRNAINHGSIDFSDQNVIMKIKPRLFQLRLIVLRMFSLMIPVRSPIDDGRETYATQPGSIRADQ